MIEAPRTRTEYPTGLVDEITVLPDHMQQPDLTAKGLFVVEGLTVALAEQLIERSKEPAVAEMCPDAVKKGKPGRFGNMDNVIGWQLKERFSTPLVREAGNGALKLYGMLWLGPESPKLPDEPHIPGATTTFAMRMYEGATRQRLASPYLRAGMAAHGEYYGNEGAWLEHWDDNLTANDTYANNGFVKVAQIPSKRHGVAHDRVYRVFGEPNQETLDGIILPEHKQA